MYNEISDEIIKIAPNWKKKGEEYGYIIVNRKNLSAFAEAIDLMSVAPLITPKFSERIEKFLLPRFNEIVGYAYSNKNILNDFKIEISKENHKDIKKSLKLPSVKIGLEERGYSIEEISDNLESITFMKYKN